MLPFQKGDPLAAAWASAAGVAMAMGSWTAKLRALFEMGI